MTDPSLRSTHANGAQPCDLELLALFSVGELDAARRAAVSAHLVDCAGCWDNLSAQRVITGAVQRLWEPAPAGLRADIRAAITADPGSRSHPVRWRIGVLAASLVVALATGGVVATLRPTSTQHQEIAEPAPLPAPVQAAIAQTETTPLTASSVPTGPDLTTFGLWLAASGSTSTAGLSASRYTYADRAGHRLTVFVAAQAWPRPAQADPITTTAWILTPTALTVVGGRDQAGEDMLIIASDHTVAMTAAAALGLF